MAPPQRRTVTRRTFLGYGAGAGALLLLAACGGDDGGGSGDAALAATIPSRDQPVTWPRFDDNPAIADGLPPESGTLKIANYADYVSPELVDAFSTQYGVKVEVSTFENGPELLSKLSSGALEVDLVLSGAIDLLPRYVAGKLIQPINRSYLTNFDNLWDSAKDPFYDKGLIYTVPYTVYSTGIGYRADRVDAEAIESAGWDALWDPSYKGHMGILNDPREAFAMAFLKLGKTNINAPGPGDIDAAAAELTKLVKESNAKVDVVAYQKLPEGSADINQAWSGDLVIAASGLPEGTGPEALGYWVPPADKAVVGSDVSLIMKGAKHPVLAHQFLDMLLDPANALTNLTFTGYQGQVKGLETDKVIAAGVIPENLSNTLVTDEMNAKSLVILPMKPEDADALDRAWSTFIGGG